MCVAYSIELITAYHELEERGTLQRFSQGYIYGNRADNHYKGEGMYPREALSNFRIYGTPPNNIFSNRGTYPMLKDKITPEMHSLAATQRIKSYSAIQTVDEIKTALMENGAVLIVIPIYNSFYNCPTNGILALPDTANENILGYHAIVIIGWREDNRWIVQNSWGQNWGDRSMSDYCMCYMPFEYPITEKWSLVDEFLPIIKESQPCFEDFEMILQLGKNEYYINSNKVNYAAPILSENRTMVPIRLISEQMGLKVDWVSNNLPIKITGKRCNY